jgi:hypothetical protein
LLLEALEPRDLMAGLVVLLGVGFRATKSDKASHGFW